MEEQEINETIMRLRDFEQTSIGWTHKRANNFDIDVYPEAIDYARNNDAIMALIAKTLRRYKSSFEVGYVYELGEWHARLSNNEYDTGIIVGDTPIIAKCKAWIEFTKNKDVSKRWAQ